MFEVVQGSARVLNIKKTRKTRGGLISGGGGGGGAYNRMIFFQVDGLITRGGGISGWGYNRTFTVFYNNKSVLLGFFSRRTCTTFYATVLAGCKTIVFAL